MARVIWIHGKEPTVADILAKKTAINLLAAFAVSTKHYLRQEYDHGYDDLKFLVAHIPKYAMPSSNESYEDQVNQPNKWNRWLHPTSGTNGLRQRKSLFHTKSKARSDDAFSPETSLNDTEIAKFRGSNNIPLEISLYLSSYINSQRQKDLLDVPSTTATMNALNSLVECLTGFERILRTPIPAAYSIHLSQTIWLYVLALPFQLVGGFGYVTIIIQAIASFTLLGIEAIGKEIENVSCGGVNKHMASCDNSVNKVD
jgi:putative membrane protein